MVRVIPFERFNHCATSWEDTLFVLFSAFSANLLSFEPFNSSVKPSSVMKCLRMKFPTGSEVRGNCK